MLTDNNYA